MKEYKVMAQRWDDEKRGIVYYVAGTFEDIVNVRIFKEAYEKFFSTQVVIAEVEKED